MAFDTFLPGFEESLVLDSTLDDTRGTIKEEHPDDRVQRLRHEDDLHKQNMKHRDDHHDMDKRHREEAHKHNLKKAEDNDFAYAPAVYAYSEPSATAHFTTAGQSPNAGAGTSGTTTDTPSGTGAGGASSGGAGGGQGAA